MTRRIALISICMLSLALQAAAYIPQTVPSPKRYGQDFFVSNPDSILADSTVRQLNTMFAQLWLDTEVEMAVVVIDTMDSGYDAYDFALELFNHWGIGGAEKNTGLLVFLAYESRDIQIITGDGISGIITDAKCGEILDDNLYYLSVDDFDRGIIGVCCDIRDFLMLDEHRGELLLGWAPEGTEGADILTWWIIIGFVLMIILALKGYKQLQPKPGQSVREIEDNAANVRVSSGCLMLFFPFPLLFFYIYYKLTGRRVKILPPNCKNCGHQMEPIPAEEKAEKTSKEQKTEEALDSFQYHYWRCPECGTETVLRHKGYKYSKYLNCPQCKAEAMKLTGKKTLVRATFFHDGKRQDTYTCQCCGHQMQKTILIEQKHLSSGGGLGSGSSSSGSWGGGHSSGGGAGRSF